MFVLPRHQIRDVRTAGSSHLRVELRSDAGGTIQAMAFRASSSELGEFLARGRGNRVHVAGQVQANYWNGARSVQFRICDAAPAAD
jgi:single-stranded-DNA-specific exonuclease